ncbi:MAG: hypothetical protein PHS54_02975 [Clostridia bacterium]|nr:hypothetical protein [Clostridia bacterium]
METLEKTEEQKETEEIKECLGAFESLKLTKNSKGYTWEIKIAEINIDRLDEINNKMLERYSN